MQRALGPVHDEVVDQPAVAVERLGADARGAGQHVAARSSSGTKRRRSATKARLLAAWRISVSPVRQKRPISLQVPARRGSSQVSPAHAR